MAKDFLSLSWYSDLKAESDLTRMAVQYEVTQIPFAKIDLKESQVNGARLQDAIRHHKVEDYMQGFRNGDTFPRPVVVKTPTGYVILSGNQRCEAIRRLIAEGELPKDTKIDVYLVHTDDKLLLEIIARAANAAHGEGDTKEERIQQAMYCVRKLGMAVKDAAKSFLVATTTINLHMRAEEQRNRLAKSGISTQHIPTTVLEPLAKLDFDESIQHRLGTLIAQHSLPGERVKQAVGTLVKQSSAAQRQSVLKDLEKECSTKAHAKNGSNGHHSNTNRIPERPRRDKLFSIAQRLSNFLESENGGEAFTSLEQMQIVNGDTENAVKLLKKIHYRIGVILK